MTSKRAEISRAVRHGAVAALVLVAHGAAQAQAQGPTPPPPPSDQLRVCADPKNLPLSNDKGEGYENKIAEAMAQGLGRKLVYTWYPQRMGFIRQTLRGREPDTGSFKCDLIIGVPKEYELAATTVPYMRSTYAMVFRNRPDLASVKAPGDLLALPAATRSQLKFAIFGRSPAADWLLRNQLFEQSTSYAPQSGDPNVRPESLVEDDLGSGKVDVAMLWGPIAASLARRDPQAWRVVPFPPEAAGSDIQFDFEISMGVRYGEKPWKDTVEGWIKGNRAQINTILTDYQIPLLPLQPAVAAK